MCELARAHMQEFAIIELASALEIAEAHSVPGSLVLKTHSKLKFVAKLL